MALHQRDIGVVKTLLGLVTKLANRIVHAVETGGDRTQNVALAALQIVQSKTLIDISASSPALACGVVNATGIAIAAPAEHAKNQKQDDPGGPVATPAKTAVSVSIDRLYLHGGFRIKRHIFSPFSKLFQIRGHGDLTLFPEHAPQRFQHSLNLMRLLLRLVQLVL